VGLLGATPPDGTVGVAPDGITVEVTGVLIPAVPNVPMLPKVGVGFGSPFLTKIAIIYPLNLFSSAVNPEILETGVSVLISAY